MFAEEEVELKDQIIQNLENCGFLNKIKAELRAGVFLALEEEGILRSKNPLLNKKFDDFLQTDEGKLTVSTVREFLEYFELNFTLSVFDSEIAATTPCATRTDLCEQLKQNSSEIQGPILSFFVKDKMPNALQKENDLFVSAVPSQNAEVKKNTLTLSESITVDPVKSDIKNTFAKEDSKTSLEDDHDPFFDEPLPSEKPNYFSLDESENFKSQAVVTNEKQSFINSKESDSDKNSLSSLRNLPSLTNKNLLSTDRTFSKPSKNTLPSLEVPESTVKGDINTDEENLQSIPKTNSDNGESIDDGSEKQLNSEESIEEEIEEDFSAGLDDLLNSSLSLGEDVTTDQTVSQVSVGGCDHIEQCDSLT